MRRILFVNYNTVDLVICFLGVLQFSDASNRER